MRKRSKKISIKAKLLGIMILLVILPSLALGIIASNSSEDSLNGQYEKFGLALGNELTRSLDQYLSYYVEKTEALSEMQAIKDYNLDGSPERREAAISGIKGFLSSFKTQNAVLADLQGNMDIIEKSGKVGNVNVKDQEWFKKVLSEKKTYISDLYEGSGKQLLTVGVPIMRGEELVGVVGVDIPLEDINAEFSSINIGDTGFPILVDRNGVIVGTKMEQEFGTEFVGRESFIDMEEDFKVFRDVYVNPEGESQEQLKFITRLKGADWKLVTIIPTGEIAQDINKMAVTILVAGLVIAALGVVISMLFSNSFIRIIKKLLAGVKQMAEGDFTEKIEIKSNDELGELAESFNVMTEKLSALISDIKSVSKEVSSSSHALAKSAEATNISSDEISRTVEEIAHGASEQASDTERGVSLVTELSMKLEELRSNSENTLASVESINSTNRESTEVVSELRKKTEQNNRSTNQIENEIIELDSDIARVGDILAAIDSIAEQTNLLALNASIEAARAGEAGKGFAVVAEEIRKLAEESKSSSNDIKDIILAVQGKSGETVKAMEEVKAINVEQNGAVDKVGHSFDTISELIEDISIKLEEMGRSIEDMNRDKEAVVSAMENISSVSQETAAASEEVTASVEQQSLANDEVSRAADSLNELSEKLIEEMDIFKIRE
ncbi:methyl-accepting chemotaxis protein McpA [Andreesenia angusta]|uniref:Methyl-accepting chemotaxis protein McpA n=1 Tax=Andreesenia angusta TaxID=39480 RepID=A0A1S1VCN6_9FIRM|nr:methyl-accepting chemotaxis protein [Andreesenia angusta]OHW63549.1 methyl-accepting chemotaxis protein McpA [Andreesenia angusta]